MPDAFTSAALSKVMQSPTARPWRLFLLAIAALAMVAGLWSGLVRLGVAIPAGMPPAAELHGALMICGFLGTLISLERAVALGRWWAYAAPVLSAVGAVVLLAGAPHIGALAFIAAGGFLLAACGHIVVRHPALFTVVLAAGAACWATGSMTGARVRYTAFAYVPLAFLHASVLLRVGSDMLEWIDLRAGSGMVTVLALLSYAATLLFASGRATRRRAA